MRLVPVAGIAISLLLAGCASGESTGDPLATDLPVTDETGALRGIVIDDAINALPGATVTVVELEINVTTGPDGQYTVANLLPGTYTVIASLDGYSREERTVEIVAGAVASMDFTLTIGASDEAYHVIQQKKGRTFCSLGWRGPIPPGFQVAGRNVSDDGAFTPCGAAYDTPVASLDSFVVIFDLTTDNISAVQALALETHWIRTQTFGSGLTVLWENYQELIAYTFTEDVRHFAEVEGTSPLIAIVDQAAIWENMTHWDPPPKYCSPNSTCRFWARVFPYASTFGPGAAADVSIYFDQPYDHYVTEFYRKDPPPGYTAIADA